MYIVLNITEMLLRVRVNILVALHLRVQMLNLSILFVILLVFTEVA